MNSEKEDKPVLENVDIHDMRTVRGPDGSRYVRIRYSDRCSDRRSDRKPLPRHSPLPEPQLRRDSHQPAPEAIETRDPKPRNRQGLPARFWANPFGKMAVIAATLNVLYIFIARALT